ncbi:SsgA family sporulation/cell division regulator [Kitasatospora arboriphila]|uniref:SsgA family sporulation/cell division regulator n=1 Tax=Kitasatospora arboriphila TaxID=258052 RepID=A0ABN1U655_9ACTN
MSGGDIPQVPHPRTPVGGCAMPLVLWAAPQDRYGVEVAARLRYDAAEPYAAFLDCHINLPQPITWAFARSLLSAGALAPVGIGDVRVRPGSILGRPAVLISLTGEHGTVHLWAAADDVQQFLAHTRRIVDVGRESEHLDLDRLLQQLLDHPDA